MSPDLRKVASVALLVVAGWFGYSAYRAHNTPAPLPGPALGRSLPDGALDGVTAPRSRFGTADLLAGATAPSGDATANPMVREPATRPTLEDRIRPHLAIPAPAVPTPARPWKRSATYAVLSLAAALALAERGSAR